MAYRAIVVPVMIASPGDVSEEREAARSIIHEWNDINAARSSVVLEPVGWETHSSPELGARAQSLINERVLKDCDLLIGIFWTRLGTPTGEEASGTVEEIKRHVESGKPAMLYFSSKPAAPESIDPQQYAAVQSFRDECMAQGIVEKYDQIAEFRDKLRKQIQVALTSNEYLKSVTKDRDEAPPSFQRTQANRIASAAPRSTSSGATISGDAATLLDAAVSSDGGEILNIAFVGGREISAGGKSFGKGSEREVARWEAALAELVNQGFVQRVRPDGTVNRLTHEGWSQADQV